MDLQAFYGTAAQVIPVLLLALLFEARVFRDWVHRTEREASTRELYGIALGVIGIVVIPLLGEVAALQALGSGSSSGVTRLLVAFGIAAPMGILVDRVGGDVMRSLVGAQEVGAPHSKRVQQISAGAAVALSLVGALILDFSAP